MRTLDLKIWNSKINYELIIRVAAFSVLWGRAWEHWFFNPPVHAIFWNYDLVGWFVEGVLNIPWNDFLTTPSYDHVIITITQGIGWVYGITALSCLLYNGRSKWFKTLLIVSTILLVILAVMETLDKFNAVAQFFEHTSQFTAPFLVYLLTRNPNSINYTRLIVFLKTVVALTFIAHGLYAIGFYKQPSIFIKMIRSVLGTSYESTVVILKLIGAFDIIAGLLLFISNGRIVKIVLVHLIAWGFITALGRVFGITNWEQFGTSFSQLWFQTTYRLPHGLLPLALLGLIVKYNTIRQIPRIFKPFTKQPHKTLLS